VSSVKADLRATAYHEAAHAVAFFVLGMSPTRATIVPTDETAGSASHAAFSLGHLDVDEITPTRRDRIERKIIAALAGAVAEERLAGCDCSATARQDHASAADLALRVCGGQRETNAYLAWLYIRTEMLIERRWPAIEALAAILLERRTLHKRELPTTIQRILDPAGIAASFRAATPAPRD